MPNFARRRSGALCAVILAAVLAAFPGVVAAQQNLPPAVQALLPAAKAEGATISLYGPEFDPTQNAAMSKAMSALYGMDFDLKLMSALHPAKAAEIVQGAKMGVGSGIDIFWTGSAIGVLLEQGSVVSDFDWFKSLGVDEKLRWGANAIRIHDPMLAGVSYNTKLVSEAEAPRSYEDLVKNPKWKGQIAVPRAPNVFVYMSYGYGDEPTRKLITDLINIQDMRILPTYPDVTNRVIAGEFAIGIGVTPILQHRKGAPVATAPIEPVILTPWALFLMKDAKHPATAKLFGYWLASAEGQKTLSEVTALSLASAPGTDIAKLVEGKKVITVPPEFNTEVLPKLGPVYGKLMGLR